MATLFVSNTMASCTGFLFKAEGTDSELDALRQAAEAFNTDEAWRGRGCDGSVALQENEAAVVAFWKGHAETRARTLKGVEKLLEEDGMVIRCAASDLADFLRSHERQLENQFPAAI